MSSFSPALFFPAPVLPALAADCTALSQRFRAAMAAAQKGRQEDTQPDVSLLYGPKDSGKSRLLLQLAYRLAAECASPSASAASSSNGSSSSLPDPFQQVLLLLPASRQLSAGASTSSPLLGLFGPAPQAQVLDKIQIKWYKSDHDLLSTLCHLPQYAPSSPSNLSRVPPRFVGVVYEAALLSTEAAAVALAMARLCEAVSAINSGDNENKTFAPCQSLFCMSHVASVGRLKTLLPRYARCVFEVTPGTSPSSWLLHTRPLVSPSLLPLSALEQLLRPMNELSQAQPLSAALPSHQPQLALSPMQGMPIMQYNIQQEVIEIGGILI